MLVKIILKNPNVRSELRLSEEEREYLDKEMVVVWKGFMEMIEKFFGGGFLELIFKVKFLLVH